MLRFWAARRRSGRSRGAPGWERSHVFLLWCAHFAAVQGCWPVLRSFFSSIDLILPPPTLRMNYEVWFPGLTGGQRSSWAGAPLWARLGASARCVITILSGLFRNEEVRSDLGFSLAC